MTCNCPFHNGEIIMALQAFEMSQAQGKLLSAGLSPSNASSIVDWLSGLGISFTDILAVIEKFIAASKDGITWTEVWDLVSFIVSLLNKAAPPAPVVVLP
jgi:uncharacterized protein (DUF697 family)